MRKFVRIDEEDLREKVKAIADDDGFDIYELRHKLKDDIKVRFDLENWENEFCYWMPAGGLLGIHTLPNGLTFWGMYGGGDWESGVFFIVYWDGKRVRAYVPTDGNPWNTDTKEAFGNDPEKDLANAKKRWPERFADIDEDDMPDVRFDTDYSKIKEEIYNHFVERT